MKPTIKLAIAQLLASAGAVLSAFAVEMGGSANEPAEPQTSTPEPQPEKVKRGRTAKPQPEPAQEPQPEPAAQPETPAPGSADEGETPQGKTYEELRALIEPLVKGGQGAEVKKIIAKYGTTLKDMPPQHHAAFEKDLATLSY